jgi:hypothetical protein
MDAATRPAPVVRALPDRRRSPRVELIGAIQGRHANLNTPVTVLEVSATGFSVKSPVPFELDEEQVFRLRGVDGRQATVRARTMHCMRASAGGEEATYVVGFALIGESVEQMGALRVGRHTSASPEEPERSSAAPADGSRRRSPRFDVSGLIEAWIDGGSVALTMHDLSLGGFSAETTIGIRPGTRHQVIFKPAESERLIIDAEAVHCRLLGSGRAALFLTGFKFVFDTDEAAEAVERLVEAATSPLSFL